MILRLEGEEREEFEGLYDNFATEAAAKGWDDELIANRIAQDLSPKLTRATFDQIDLKVSVNNFPVFSSRNESSTECVDRL